ncbi:MAG: hypothetical protein JXR39_08650 [Marinilabiliaceae bacterium]|nr:hypothetical protein [Marinilabiliaceae bacterium]
MSYRYKKRSLSIISLKELKEEIGSHYKSTIGMNQLYIIGNGFDLAHGMKTKYTDFIVWYLNGVYTRLVKTGVYEDELVRSTRKKDLPEIEINSITKFDEYIKNDLFEFIYKNNFFKLIINDVSIRKWIDIEELYFRQLLLYDAKRKVGETWDEIDGFVQKHNDEFHIIKILLKEYLAGIDVRIYSPIVDIHSNLNSYLAKYNIGVAENQRALFLNFNYTKTLDLYSDLLTRHKAYILHIHGEADNDKQGIVFGYGDEMNDHYIEIEKLNKNEYLRNFKSFDYFKANQYRQFLQFINRDIFNVFILGHSCGLSDRILLNSIFEHENCNEIQIFYYDKGNGENDFIEKTYEISRHFSGSKKGEMRKKIVPFENSEPLVRVNWPLTKP